MQPTARVRACERSSIRVLFDLAESLDGDLVRLEVGEPDFETPEHVVEAACKALRDGHHGYTPANGIKELREAGMEDAQVDALKPLLDELAPRLNAYLNSISR